MITQTSTPIPSGVTLGVQCYEQGWSGTALAAPRDGRRDSIEAWRAEYPTLAVTSYVNHHDPGEPFVMYAWHDDSYWPTPEDAFASIVRRVLADVRDVDR